MITLTVARPADPLAMIIVLRQRLLAAHQPGPDRVADELERLVLDVRKSYSHSYLPSRKGF